MATAAAGALVDLGVDVCGPTARRGWTIVVLVDPDGGRRFLTDIGDIDPWPEPDMAWLDQATRLHFSGYAVASERSVDACLALAERARVMGVPRSVDVCSTSAVEAWGVDRFVDAVAEIRPDVVKMNIDEACLLGDQWAPWAWHVVTNGAGDTRLLDPDGCEQVVPVAPAPVVDSTGAGDAFVAGFLAAWDAGELPVAAVMAGHSAAARVVAGPGADAWQDGRHAP